MSETDRSSTAVVLVRPQKEGNIGATARAMANMGLETLVLVAPTARLGDTARAFAVGAGDILDRARETTTLAEALGPFRRVVGTTSGRDRRPDPQLITPRELPERLAEDPPATPTALVFGPEASGLTAEELALCSLLVRVPCAPEQPTLNLAQAVLLLAYELSLARERLPTEEALDEIATTEDIDGLFDHLESVLGAVGFARDDTYRGVLRDLRSLAARAMPTEREIRILRGICRRTSASLARTELSDRSRSR